MSSLARLALPGLVAMWSTLAHGDDITYQLETSVASSYVARGIVQYASRDVASSQNAAALRVDHVADGALLVSAWNAIALSGYDAQPGTALELDLSVGYERHVGQLAVSTGYAGYLFPKHLDGTPFDGGHELWAAVSYDNPYLVPSAAAYVEVVRQQGLYLMVGTTRDLHHQAWTFSPAISVGGAGYRRYLGGDQAAGPHVNDGTAAFAARRDLDRGVYAAVKLYYAFRATPSELMDGDDSWGFSGRSAWFGLLAVGFAR